MVETKVSPVPEDKTLWAEYLIRSETSRAPS